jgi:hypothetical protein
MIIFSFKKCVSESEAKKVKKFYLIISIVLFTIFYLVVGSISKNIFPSMNEELKKSQPDFKIIIKQAMEQSEKIPIPIKFVTFSIQASFIYLSVWACLKLGMGKIFSIILGIITLAPFISIIPFIIVLTRKFSPDKKSLIIQQ